MMVEEPGLAVEVPVRERFRAAREADHVSPGWSFDALSSQASAVVADAPADAELLVLLEEQRDGRTTPDEALLVELIAAADRLQNHVAGLQAGFVGELVERRRGSMGLSRTRDELALRLATTGHAAETLVGRASALVVAPEVAKALDRGALTPRKADLITDATEELALEQARAVQAHGVAYAEHHTGPQLRRELEAAVLAVDPSGAEREHEKAHARRRVVREQARHGMEWVSALLPAEAAACAYTAIDGLAADCAADDERTIDQRRADAFTRVFEEILATGSTAGGAALPDRHGRRPVVRISVTETVLAGDGQSPAVLHGYGPISAGTARRLAAGAVLERRSPSGGALDMAGSAAVRSAVRGGTGPPESVLARDGVFARADSGWRDPMSEVLPPGQPPGVPDGTDRGQLIEWVHRRVEWVRRRAGSGGEATSHDVAGDIAGVVEQGGSAVTPDAETADPGDPCVLVADELGLVTCDSYAPSRRLRDLITERDQTCRFPGCLVPAWRCQLDHIVPFDPALPAWAQTVETNMQCLCAHHHQGKTERAFSVERDARSGITTWRTRTGHLYTRLPERWDLTALTVQLRRAAAGVWTGEDVDDVLWWDEPPDELTPPPVSLLHEHDLLIDSDVLEEIRNQHGDAA